MGPSSVTTGLCSPSILATHGWMSPLVLIGTLVGETHEHTQKACRKTAAQHKRVWRYLKCLAHTQRCQMIQMHASASQIGLKWTQFYSTKPNINSNAAFCMPSLWTVVDLFWFNVHSTTHKQSQNYFMVDMASMYTWPARLAKKVTFQQKDNIQAGICSF